MPYARKKRVYKRRPKRPTYKKKGKKTSFANRAWRGSASTSLPLGQIRKVIQQYISNGASVNPGVGGLASAQVWRANSLYDFDLTGVGSQPTGFDELMTMYDRYTVIGVKLQVTFMNMSASNCCRVGCSLLESPTALTDPRQYIENGSTKFMDLSPLGSSKDRCTLTQSVSIKKFFNSKSMTSDDQLSGSSASNPSKVCYWHTWGANDQGTDSEQIYMSVKAQFISLYSDPKSLAIS